MAVRQHLPLSARHDIARRAPPLRQTLAVSRVREGASMLGFTKRA
jgi:hypothetical protein